MSWFKVQEPTHPVMTVTPENTVQLFCAGDEMLRISPDGFYVRGIKLENNDQEAVQVYNAFKAWLAWASLTQQS
jgi:hypothetical protein